ncbi:hypothetical protein L6164_000932 [Bauhinia variegata]|uniref:Uncharacterized protein n=1 Tax=Bauhinia variegata TaxID=167791 RepID=A0ACB9Q8K7_BAUVA|nr:hypothetical protein L6164_000932 [Bauhinia variegata]
MASGSESISLVLQEARQSMERDYEISSSKVQPVPPLFQEGDKYAKYCRPKVISIGPIHHGDPKLKRGEQYKLMWASMFAERNEQNPDDLHKRVLDNIADLRKSFSWEEIRTAYKDEDLAFMLLVDGCSMIQILEKGDLFGPQELKIKVDQLFLVQRDLLMLENQLPYQVLKLLVHDEMQLELSMRGFCEFQNMFKVLSRQRLPIPRKLERQKQIRENTSPPAHLLDCLYKTILSNWIGAEEAEDRIMSFPVNLLDEERITYRTIRELKASAFQIKRGENGLSVSLSIHRGFFFDIPTLSLPPLILDDLTIPILLNLIAYEMCPDFKNAFLISSFIKFLDLLIDDPEDVKELRKEGILQSSLGSDQQVSELFNTIGSGLLQDHYSLSFLKSDMESYYKNKFRSWMAEAYYTHCRSPWTIIALVAATTLLVLTFIQTIKSL